LEGLWETQGLKTGYRGVTGYFTAGNHPREGLSRGKFTPGGGYSGVKYFPGGFPYCRK